MTPKYKNWIDFTIKDFEALHNITENNKLSAEDREFHMLAFMYGISVDDFYNLSLESIRVLKSNNDLMFINQKMPVVDIKNLKKIKIQDTELVLNKDITEMTYAQYVDYQTIGKDPSKSIADFLTTILIPKGKKYNEGYSIQELRQLIEENLDIQTAQAILFFYTRRLRTSTMDTLISFHKTLKNWTRMMRWTKKENPEIKKKMKEAEENLQQMADMCGSIFSMPFPT